MSNISYKKYQDNSYGIILNNGTEARFKLPHDNTVESITVIFEPLSDKIIAFKTAIISLTEASTYEIKEYMLRIFKKIMAENQFVNVRYSFIVTNQAQYDDAIKLGESLNIEYNISDVNNRHQNPELSNELSAVDTPKVTRQVYLQGDFIFDAKTDKEIGLISFGYEKKGDILWFGDKEFAHIIDENSIQRTSATNNGMAQGQTKTRSNPGAPAYYTPPASGEIKSTPIGRGSGRSAAFVNLPVIMFILSSLLLLGSIILLFILD